jgi:hypothetical protein
VPFGEDHLKKARRRKGAMSRGVSAENSVTQINPRSPQSQDFKVPFTNAQ